MRDQLGPVQGKDSVSPIEAQDEAIWTFMCMAMRKCDKRFFGSHSPSMSVARGSATRVSQLSTSIRSAEAVFEKIASAASTSESATLDVRPLPCRSRLFK